MTAQLPEDPAILYAQRQARLDAAIALQQPDRVPTVFYTMFWQAQYAGITCRQAMYDYQALSDATRKCLLDLQPDAFMLPHPAIAMGPTMEALDYKVLRWPGHGTDENVSFQYIDREYMTADEYDEYVFDPTGYLLTKYLPRIADNLSGFKDWPDLPASYYIQFLHATRSFTSPELMAGFAALQKAGEHTREMLKNAMGFAKEAAGLGFPLSQLATALAPFDYFADNFRGSKHAMLDMFRRKDKLLAAMEKAEVFIARQAIAVGSRSPCKIVFIPIHWAMDGFMSKEHFELFFWKPLRNVLMRLIDAGLVPLLLWEADVTGRLEIISDVPRGKCIYWFERTDIFRAKEVLGDITCIRGNVPASMLITGTPDDVTEYCRKLIDIVGRGGGFILDGGIGIPDEAKVANVHAMFNAARTYGVY